MIGAIDRIEIADGVTADLYLLRFDKNGRLTSPQTAEAFLEASRRSSDVFVFSHGWNNTYDIALRAYRSFIEGYVRQRRDLRLPVPPDYRPVLLGVIWPATSFVLPWESGPEIAAGDGSAQSTLDEEMLTLVVDSLPHEDEAALTELIDGRSTLTREDAVRAADLVLSALWADEAPDVDLPRPTGEDFVLSWQALDEVTNGHVDLGGEDDFGSLEDDVGGLGGDGATGGDREDGEPLVAGGLSLDPRNLLRAATVWTMKARAGRVGAAGVGPLVRTVLGHQPPPRVHMIGHSFGARVVLSAVAAGSIPARVHSMLLLQPAVNRWCFAPRVPGVGVAGGYHPVLERVVKPILTTFSNRDVALHQAFHLAVRGSSLGEPDIAAVGNTHLYGALGGYGPAGLDDLAVTVPAVAPGSPLYRSSTARVIAIDGGVVLDGAAAIGGHSDVINEVTAWALHSATSPEG